VGTLDRIGRVGGLASAAEGMAAYRARYPFAPPYIAVTNITDEVLLAGEQYMMPGGRMVTLLRDLAPGASGVGY
jgi:hypothetical protein